MLTVGSRLYRAVPGPVPGYPAVAPPPPVATVAVAGRPSPALSASGARTSDLLDWNCLYTDGPIPKIHFSSVAPGLIRFWSRQGVELS